MFVSFPFYILELLPSWENFLKVNLGIINAKISIYLKLELFYINCPCAHGECTKFIEVMCIFPLSITADNTPLTFFEILFLAKKCQWITLHWSLVSSLLCLHETATSAGSATRQSSSHILNISFGHEWKRQQSTCKAAFLFWKHSMVSFWVRNLLNFHF